MNRSRGLVTAVALALLVLGLVAWPEVTGRQTHKSSIVSPLVNGA